jgi:phytoene dehydrogenase-like protein
LTSLFRLGTGGYVAAIRAAQLGLKAAVVEREHVGGICLNWAYSDEGASACRGNLETRN